jgi:hypothetical protein
MDLSSSSAELGPLAALVGTWEGAVGIDVAYSNARGVVAETPFRERITFSPFGPVENGRQVLFGLDYRMAAWRLGEEGDPFHTEIGYWLWDGAANQVMRCFMVPRGVTVLAGGTAAADARTFTMTAETGSETYGIAQNRYLHEAAKTLRYEVTIDVTADGTFTYAENTVLQLAATGTTLDHTDRNTLHRVA